MYMHWTNGKMILKTNAFSHAIVCQNTNEWCIILQVDSPMFFPQKKKKGWQSYVWLRFNMVAQVFFFFWVGGGEREDRSQDLSFGGSLHIGCPPLGCLRRDMVAQVIVILFPFREYETFALFTFKLFNFCPLYFKM